MPSAIIYINSALLFLAVLPFPYGYYTLVRIVTASAFIRIAVVEYKKDASSVMIWVLILVAILFNPIIPIHLTKPIWMPLNIAASIFLLFYNKRGA